MKDIIMNTAASEGLYGIRVDLRISLKSLRPDGIYAVTDIIHNIFSDRVKRKSVKLNKAAGGHVIKYADIVGRGRIGKAAEPGAATVQVEETQTHGAGPAVDSGCITEVEGLGREEERRSQKGY